VASSRSCSWRGWRTSWSPSGPDASARRALVFGLSGQVGAALRGPLLAAGWRVDAVARQPREDGEGVRWHVGGLPDSSLTAGPYDAIVSVGPLDVFAQAVERHGIAAARVVALGSTGVHSKADSPDPAERDLAARLAQAESRLCAALAGRAPIALLRPTLVYGHGLDRSLTALVDFARRRGWLVLPRSARGLRQPVHVDDVAAAVLACLQAPAPVDAAIDVPGGETLAFDAMVARTLARHAPGARVWRVPAWIFRLGLALAGWRLPRAVSAPGFVGRLNRDQVFDPAPAQCLLGRPLRPFDP
jgi:nucleoside-diphosphate-sugar epimerase